MLRFKVYVVPIFQLDANETVSYSYVDLLDRIDERQIVGSFLSDSGKVIISPCNTFTQIPISETDLTVQRRPVYMFSFVCQIN